MDLLSIVQRLEAVADRLEGNPLPAAPQTADEPAAAEIDPVIVQLIDIIESTFGKIASEAGDVSEEVAEAAAKALSCVNMMLALVDKSLRAKKPAMDALMVELQPIMEGINALSDPPRQSPHYDHLKALGESMSTINWVVLDPAMGTPAAYIKETGGSAMMFANRVRKGMQGKDNVHTRFAATLGEYFTKLEAYVKENFKTGLRWCPNGDAIADVTSTAAAAAPKAAAPKAAAPVDMFAELKGKDPTSSLKHVTKDMKTKNQPKQPPIQPKAAPAKKAVQPAVKKTYPPKTELVNYKKWEIEHHVDNKAITVDAEKHQSVYLYNLTGCLVQIKGKVNQVTIDKCTKTDVIVDTVVSTVETINSKRIQLQVSNTCPTVMIDNTVGMQVHLDETARATEFHTALSSEVNVLPMWEDVEIPLPHQFVHKIVGKTVTTTPEEYGE